ncbi:MAG: flagellar motor protein MotB [Sandaracinaceae bacterium]
MDEEAECECEEGAPAWMSTFSDMATLLLTFFVLLLSFANMDVVEFRTMMGSVRDAFGVQHESPGEFMARSNSPISVAPGGSPSNPSILQQATTVERIRTRLNSEGLGESVEVSDTERGIVMRIREAVLFGSGSATLVADGLPILERIASIAMEFARQIRIEGHTDDRPIATGRFPSNWELSAARATAVLRHLERSGTAADAMSIAGYADTRPVAANTEGAGRAQNRRVEFVLVDATGSPVRNEEAEAETAEAETAEAETAEAETAEQADAEGASSTDGPPEPSPEETAP